MGSIGLGSSGEGKGAEGEGGNDLFEATSVSPPLPPNH